MGIRKSTSTTCLIVKKTKKAIKRIHVNQFAIRRNLKCETDDPVITVKQSKDNTYGHEVLIYDKHGELVATVTQPLDKKLDCGARVWVETSCTVEVVDRNKKTTKILP